MSKGKKINPEESVENTKKINELTPMEKLMYTIGQKHEASIRKSEQKVLSEVMKSIEELILKGMEEKMFIKFYVMTRMFVLDEMSEKDVEKCWKEAVTSFMVIFNTKSLFDEEINFLTKNN